MHAFSVDVEDWYQGIPISKERWRTAERRLEQGLNRLLDILAEHGVRATFFLLGPVVEEHPVLARRIGEANHELGCHGWSHDLVYEMTPDRFREETKRAMGVISDVTGKGVTAYRAAYFSITRKSLWALDVLAELGFRYDSSIYPVKNWRYGIPDFEPRPQRIETQEGPIYELPLSIWRVMNTNIPVSGGAYFRIYPYRLTWANIRALEKHRRPVVFYIHPWEMDPDHPLISFYWKAWATHYTGLGSTERKLRCLLHDFQFAPVGDVLEDQLGESCT